MILMLNRIKAIFRRTDFALLFGFVFFVVLASYGQLYMYHQDPSEVNLSLGIATLLFLCGLISFVLFISGSFKRGEIPYKRINIISIAVLITGLVSIFQAPNVFTYEESAIVLINNFNKAIFSFDFVLIFLFIYSTLFVFSKRFKNSNFIVFLSYLAFAFCLVVLLYSYITEYDKIANYFQVLFGYKEGSLTPAASFIINSNSVGMVMLIGILMALILHSIRPHFWHYLLATYFLINISYTHCRGSLFLGAFAIIVFIFYRIIASFKEHKRRNIILLIIYSSLVLLVGALLIIVFLLNGEFLPHLYHALKMITNTTTLNSRMHIYDVSFSILKNGGWVLGYGFGSFNLILTWSLGPYASYLVPAHNAFINILGNGGVIHLAAYIALLVYSAFISIKLFKKSQKIAFALSLSCLSYFIYTFIETIQYILYLFIFLLFVFYEISKKEESSKEQSNEFDRVSH